ncbi:MAG TPA: MBL fold metallo-hydrolase [Solirubrobacterales bacterium]|nr:MBL fold metallo-hydrolase [Solirubrobacterales bacterium]
MEVTDAEAPGHPEIYRVVADNPGPMTLTGTNTYLYGSDPCWVIDPGPEDERHTAAVKKAAADRGGIGGVLLTHSHHDHSGGVEAVGVPLSENVDGERFGGLTAVATPGHAIDHFCYFTDDGVCFSGDLILGWGSTYVPPDGGSLTSYMESLRLVRDRRPSLICPAHGPFITDPAAKVEEYLEHRESRERGLIEAMDRGVRSRMALLDEVWSDVHEQLRPAANVVMEAHLQKLETEGRLPADLGE